MAYLEDRSTKHLGGTGSSGLATAEPETLVDLRDRDEVVLDLRGSEPVITVEPVSDEVIQRRWVLLVALALLNGLDLVTTRLVLDAGGAETNPLMAPIIHHPVAPILVKTTAIAFVAVLLRACPPRSRVVDGGLTGVTIGYALVVSWNLLNLVVR